MSERDRGTLVGRVASVRRYPVKSMQGEELHRASVGPGGLVGDRRFAVIDVETGRVASAKNPKKWGALLGFRAELRDGKPVVTSPDGVELGDDLGAELSRRLDRAVTVIAAPTSPSEIEVCWPEVAGLAAAGTDTVEVLPNGGFHDLAPLHLLTTATLQRFRELAGGGDFDPRRFRPNVLIETLPHLAGFVEREWVGRTLWIGETPIRLEAHCSRCVMTTLAQPGLPADPRVLRAAVAHNAATVGVYGSAVGGELADGMAVRLT